MRKTKYLKSNMNNSNFNSETQICNQRWARNFFGRLLGLKFVRALNNNIAQRYVENTESPTF